MIKDSTERGLPKRGGGGKANRVENWTPFQNSRIVRVSRAFGGKDRHSKVSTLRGLRDRRVRLSMPTAIQIYDLQEKLGLSQPSKVVDWLINAAQHEIDKLPPLQFPQNWASSSSVAAAGIGEQSQLNYGQTEHHDQLLFPVMPPSFSSYLVGTTNFEFAQFPTANFKQYVHLDEDRRAGSMRGEAEVYEDCGAVHGSNAADFFL